MLDLAHEIQIFLNAVTAEGAEAQIYGMGPKLGRARHGIRDRALSPCTLETHIPTTMNIPSPRYWWGYRLLEHLATYR